VHGLPVHRFVLELHVEQDVLLTEATPIAALARTAGCAAKMRSISHADTFSPRTRMLSVCRPMKKKSPLASRRARSPVCSLPLRKAAWAASGFLRYAGSLSEATKGSQLAT
jgi:hypothetical protein